MNTGFARIAAGLATAAILSTCVTAGRAQTSTHGIDLSAMDTTANPCTDFYRYANGHWLDTATIPSDHGGWGAFLILHERNQAILRDIAEHAVADKHATPGSAEGKVASFYRSGMDQARIDADGIIPLAPEFARIDAVHDVPSLLDEIGHLKQTGVSALFGFGFSADIKDPKSTIICRLSQGGLGLPEPGYYQRTDPATKAIRDAYVAHVTKMLTFAGETSDQADADAAAILALETQLAGVSKKPAELRDPLANYHKMTFVDLGALTPGVTWEPYFVAADVKRPGSLNVGQPDFFKALGPILTSTPMPVWKAYLRWRLIRSEAGYLSSPIENESFHFYGTTLRGIPEMQPRWQRVVSATDNALGDSLGQLYVAKTFPPEAKARALAMINNLKSVLRDDLGSLPWMTEPTRKQAVAKLDAMRVKVGYPDKWRDYRKLDVSSPSYVVNAMAAAAFDYRYDKGKLGKRPDPKEWGMTPPTVNAYYSPSDNNINFPAGILQPPFFDPQADDAVNYGAIGSVIGHEMTHGFDDQGRKFDANGHLHDWWTPADAQAFTTRSQSIVDQYSAYEPIAGSHINGGLTQGENIADIGGVKIAYLALEKELRTKPQAKIDGFTPEQRFFIALAQIWQDKERPEQLKVSLGTDPHSPAEYRVLGALADTPEFLAAFGCQPAATGSAATVW